MAEACPINFIWDGEAMTPVSAYWSREADKHFVVGERYRLVEENQRSDKSHRHEFAFIREAWNSFPDHLYEQFPSSEHLRKFGLIAKGFCTMAQYACASMTEAQRLAATLRTEADQYALITIDRAIVTVRKAESQSKKAMGAKRFQESKTALMEYVGDLLGVDPATLANVQEAA